MLRGHRVGVQPTIVFLLAAVAMSACASPTDPDGSGGRQGVLPGGAGGQNASGGSSGAPTGVSGASNSGGSTSSGGATGGAGSGGTAGAVSVGASAGADTGGTGGVGGEELGGTAGGGMAGGGTGGKAQAGTGGAAGNGGGGAAGGGKGGAAGLGGSAGSAGAAGAPNTCKSITPPTGGTEYCSNIRGRLNSGYSYELWSGGKGSGCVTVHGVDANYSASWTEADDFLARMGLVFDATQTPAQIGTITAQFSHKFTERPMQGRTSKIYVALYGWTLEPLMEYYVIEDYGDFIPGPTASDGSPRTNYGTLEVDGGIYDIWALPVTNRPAITGNNMNFTQIFNVRRVPRQCGTISLSEHFAKWTAVGLRLGRLEEAMYLMEAQNNSGTIDVTATVTLE